MKKQVQWAAALGTALLTCGLAHAQYAQTTARPPQPRAASTVQSAQATANGNPEGKTRQQVEDELVAARRSGEFQKLNHELYSHH